MGCLAILTPWRGSRKPILMVLCGACKERTEMSCRVLVAGSPAGRARGPMLDSVPSRGGYVLDRRSSHCLRQEAGQLVQEEP